MTGVLKEEGKERGIGAGAADSPFFPPARQVVIPNATKWSEEPSVKFILMICRKSRTRQGSDVGRKTMPPLHSTPIGVVQYGCMCLFYQHSMPNGIITAK